jgi:hypothetical protein
VETACLQFLRFEQMPSEHSVKVSAQAIRAVVNQNTYEAAQIKGWRNPSYLLPSTVGAVPTCLTNDNLAVRVSMVDEWLRYCYRYR